MGLCAVETQEREGIKGLEHDRHSPAFFLHQCVRRDRQTLGLKVPEKEQDAHLKDRTAQSPPWCQEGSVPQPSSCEILEQKANKSLPSFPKLTLWSPPLIMRIFGIAVISPEDSHLKPGLMPCKLRSHWQLQSHETCNQSRKQQGHSRRKEKRTKQWLLLSCHSFVGLYAAGQAPVREEMLLGAEGDTTCLLQGGCWESLCKTCSPLLASKCISSLYKCALLLSKTVYFCESLKSSSNVTKAG